MSLTKTGAWWAVLLILVATAGSAGDYRSGDIVLTEEEFQELRNQNPAEVPVVGGNILLNPGFESGSLPPWNTNNWTITNSDSNTGTYSAEDIGNFYIEQEFAPLDVSAITSVSLFARQPDEAISAIYLYYGTDDTDTLVIFPGVSWAHFDLTSELRATGQLERIRIYGYVRDGDESDLTRIDDVVVDSVIPVELESFTID